MGKKREYEFGPGETNAETHDQAAEGGNDHNEALAQRPDGSTSAQTPEDDQAALEALKRRAEGTESSLRAAETTTTTPDSVTGASAQTSDSPGDLDKLTAEERLEKARGWAKNKRTQPPMSADWQDLEAILGSGASTGERRRP